MFLGGTNDKTLLVICKVCTHYTVRTMKKKTIIRICLLILVIVAGGKFFHELSTETRHLTKTPPQEIRLHPGSNDLSFPVVSGNYLLRIGTPGLEPTAFRFLVKGKITTPSEEQSIDEIISKEVSGGYMARYIDIKTEQGTVSAHLEVTFPEKEALICLFQGVK